VIALDKTAAVGLVFAKKSIQVLRLAKGGQVGVGLDKTRVVGVSLAKTGAGRGWTRAVGLVFAKPASSAQFGENGAGGSWLCEGNGCGARFSKNAGGWWSAVRQRRGWGSLAKPRTEVLGLGNGSAWCANTPFQGLSG